MRCPCDHSDLTPDHFRNWIGHEGNREALMLSHAVHKSLPFGGAPMRRATVDGKPALVIGEKPEPPPRRSFLRRIFERPAGA